MLFVQQNSVEFFFMMITQRSIWITLLFSLLGSCKTSSPNLNRDSGNNKPLIGSGKELRWPPKIGGRDSLPPARASFKNRIGPAGIDWSNPKDVGVKPTGQKPPKNRNRLGLKDPNDYDGCLDQGL